MARQAAWLFSRPAWSGYSACLQKTEGDTDLVGDPLPPSPLLAFSNKFGFLGTVIDLTEPITSNIQQARGARASAAGPKPSPDGKGLSKYKMGCPVLMVKTVTLTIYSRLGDTFPGTPGKKFLEWVNSKRKIPSRRIHRCMGGS